MTNAALTKAERDEVVAEMRYHEAMRRQPEFRQWPDERKRASFHASESLKARYAAGLPKIAICRNPLDGGIVTKRIDIFGLDGPWWDKSWPEDTRELGAYCVTYQGAMDTSQLDLSGIALEPRDEVRPGPEVPFVIPRLLADKGSLCVISSLPLFDAHCRVYFITYFANPRPPGSEGHQPWLRHVYFYSDADGHPRWSSRADPWDFDVARWRRDAPGKIVWIEAGDESMRLVSGPTGPCPYENLPGLRQPVSIQQGVRRAVALPSGGTLDPFD